MITFVLALTVLCNSALIGDHNMTNIVSVADNVSTFTLANGSQAGRGVVVVCSTHTGSPAIASATFNGVAATANRVNPSASGSQQTLISYFSNAALPASSGAYSVAVNDATGTSLSVFELSDWDGVAPVFSDALLAGDSWTSPRSVSIAGTSANTVFVMAVNNSLGSAFNVISGQTIETSASRRAVLSKLDPTASGFIQFGTNTYEQILYSAAAFNTISAGPDYTQRKGSTFDATHTLGTITTATLNAVNVFDHVSSQAAGTISFTGAITDERTTSGVVDLVLGDGAATQTQTVQVNVFGVVPSNNPAQKDGAALASLTGVQIRITAGANLNGTQVYYSGTETTNASGNFSTLDVSTSAAAAADSVRMQVLTAAGDSITSAETVELI
jgi:hypothetical protein